MNPVQAEERDGSGLELKIRNLLITELLLKGRLESIMGF